MSNLNNLAPTKDNMRRRIAQLERELAALQARLDAAHAREDELAKALERAIQHVPKNAISVSEALSKPISKCRTQDFCELALLRHVAAKEQRNKQ